MTVRARTAVALYILNQKRAHLRDLERRFGVAVVVEADDTLTGANYHAIERGELAAGVKSEVEPPKALADEFATILEEPEPIEEEPDEAPEASSQDGQEVPQASDRAGGLSADEGDAGRRRRRRRQRRGGERSFGETPPQDAPQPTDDGLAVVAEIGGDLQAPSGEGNGLVRRGPRSEEDRERRPRRSRGQRDRFSRRPEGETRRGTGDFNFDTPPSLALEEEFAASEADYSEAPPPSHEATSDREPIAEPAQTSAHEASVEPPPALEPAKPETAASSSLADKAPGAEFICAAGGRYGTGAGDPSPYKGRAAAAAPQRLVAAGARERYRGIASPRVCESRLFGGGREAAA